MKTHALILLLHLTLCCFAITGTVSADLIVNGGFESPAVPGFISVTAPSSFSGWTVLSGGVDIVSSDFYNASSGIQSLDLNTIVSGSISQDLATTPGQEYFLSFAFAANPLPDDPSWPAPAIKVMEAHWNTSLLGTFSQDSTGHTATVVGWIVHIYTVIGTGTDRLSFASLTDGSAGPALDDVRLEPVPEPSTFVLAALGLIGLAALVWRRRRWPLN